MIVFRLFPFNNKQKEKLISYLGHGRVYTDKRRGDRNKMCLYCLF